MSGKDTIFDYNGTAPVPFQFNEAVAHVFDDMAERSIPFYREVQRMIVTLAQSYYQPGSRVYDLGCSTGTTLCLLYEALKQHNGLSLVGVDSSQAMCEKTGEKLAKMGVSREKVGIHRKDILKQSVENASVVIMNYTLQFVKPLEREYLINKIYRGLSRNGILLVSDKMLQSSTDTSRVFADIYYGFKRENGYTELEIAKKRDALLNVLIPYNLREEESLFKEAGFHSVDVFFSWFNFTSYICVKKQEHP